MCEFSIKVKSHKFIDTQPEISIKDDLIDTNILNCINQNRILDCKSQIVWQDFKHFADDKSDNPATLMFLSVIDSIVR